MALTAQVGPRRYGARHKVNPKPFNGADAFRRLEEWTTSLKTMALTALVGPEEWITSLKTMAPSRARGVDNLVKNHGPYRSGWARGVDNLVKNHGPYRSGWAQAVWRSAQGEP